MLLLPKQFGETVYMPIQPVPPPSIQIVIDLHGAPVERRHMHHAEACVDQLYGSGRKQPLFWITRTDLWHDFVYRSSLVLLMDPRKYLADEPRHEPTFDLYCDGGIVPILRIINIRVPTFDQGDYFETNRDPRPESVPSSHRAASPNAHLGATEDC